MNTTPRPPTAYPTEFRQIISEKSVNFVGREFVFSAINNFLSRQNRGYFTIVGAPGSGKSAILAKYVNENPQVIYYSAEVEGKNRAEEFLAIVCSELVTGDWGLDTKEIVFPENATSGSWFLSFLLQKISNLLAPNQKLIIAIDALDAIDSTNIPPGSNLFYLPRYLPEKVYFLLTRRPFLREKSGLLIETPAEVLNLAAYPEENQKDIQLFIEQYLSPTPPLLSEHLSTTPPLLRGAGGDLKSQLTAKSENNFMYISQILPTIISEDITNLIAVKETELFLAQAILPGLEAYYQNHWQRLKSQEFSSVELKVLHNLVTQLPEEENMPFPGRTSAEIAQLIDEDEYDVEEVLENWIEFFQLQQINGEIYYMLYHSSFRDFVRKQLLL